MRAKEVRQGGKTGLPSIYDVAERAKVSVFTVSAVINRSHQVSTKLRRRVEAAIQELEYRPNLLARSLAKRHTHTIGIIVPDISNPFFPLIVRGVEDSAQDAGYSIFLCNSDDRPEKEEHYLELLLSKQVDGILLTKTRGALSPHQQRIVSDSKVPVVQMMRVCRGFNTDAVVTDDIHGAYEAGAHLARLGYRKIGLVTGPLDVSTGRARRKGFLNALKDHHLPSDDSLMVEGDYRVESGYRAGLSLLPKRPQAVFVANYLMTAGFMKAAEEIGMECPTDFGLVSFDDYPWLGCFHPRLTTIDLPKYEVGVEATAILLDRIKGVSDRPILKTLTPQLVVRESCGFSLRIKEARQKAEVANGASREPASYGVGDTEAVA